MDDGGETPLKERIMDLFLQSDLFIPGLEVTYIGLEKVTDMSTPKRSRTEEAGNMLSYVDPWAADFDHLPS